MDVLSVSSMDVELQSEPHPDTFYDDLLVSLSNSFHKLFEGCLVLHIETVPSLLQTEFTC